MGLISSNITDLVINLWVIALKILLGITKLHMVYSLEQMFGVENLSQSFSIKKTFIIR